MSAGAIRSIYLRKTTRHLLNYFYWFHSKGLVCFPKRKTLCVRLKCSARTVSRCTRELAELGLLERRFRGPRGAIYTLSDLAVRMGRSKEHRRYLKGETVRVAVFAKRGKQCEACGKTTRIDVHHLTYKHYGNELEFLEDLRILCRPCHKAEHASWGTA